MLLSKFADVNRLYVPRKFGGRGLLAAEEVKHHEELALGHYLASNPEPWFQKVLIPTNLALKKCLLTAAPKLLYEIRA